MTSTKARIGLVDNQEAFRTLFADRLSGSGLSLVLKSWNSAEEYLRDPHRGELDLLLVDIRLTHMDGIELIRIVSEEMPEMKTAALTVADSEETIFAALRAGALGYLLKSELADLDTVISTNLEGGAIMTPTIALRMIQSFRSPADKPDFELTGRERQVLLEIAAGLTIHEAGKRLGVTDNTLNTHLKNIYKKLRVRNRIQLIERARRLGYIP